MTLSSTGIQLPRRLLLLPLLLLAACGAPPPASGPAPVVRGDDPVQEPPQLEREIKRLSKTVSGLSHTAENSRAGTTEMVKRLDLMEKELNTLRGDLEVARHENRQLKGQIVNLNEKSVQAPQPAPPPFGTGFPDAAVQAPPVTTAPVAPPKIEPPQSAPPPPPAASQVVAASHPVSAAPVKTVSGQKPASADHAYNDASVNLKSGRYVQAGAGFRDFLKWFPDDPRAPRAQYWVGETFYVQRQFREALQEFNQILLRWPKDEMVPGCLLKMGFSLYELDEKAKSRAILNRLVKEFPDSPAIHEAKKRLKKIAEAQP
ncbi:MAG: tol-pal system protein YbgF [Magnetococcales bacterium]|nr:tol-pal system protein YbgF [Magnetococcales bacterium]